MCVAVSVGGCRTTPGRDDSNGAHTATPLENGANAKTQSASSNAVLAKLRLIEAPEAGDLPAAVMAQLERSKVEQRSLIVYVGAKWCEPCRYFHEAAAAGKLDDAFPKLDVIVFDRDRDAARLDAAGYESAMIPLFVAPKADGHASDRRIEGSVKGPAAIDNIVPRLKTLL